MHVEVKLLADALDVLETLLVVGTSTTNPDLHLVLDEEGCNFSQSADDTLECRGDVGEVGNTTTDEEHLALGVLRSAEHKVEYGAGVVESLSLRGGTRVFTIVGKLTGETGRGNGIGVDDGSTTTSDKSPHPTGGVEDSELERSTSLCVHLSDVSLLFAHLATKRSWEVQRRANVDALLAIGGGSRRSAESICTASDSPLCTALKLGSLVNLGSKIEEVDVSRCGVVVGDNDKGVDLKVAGSISTM
jgi:hypothetical protein